MSIAEDILNIFNEVKKISWDGNPKIGWWLDNDPVTFYHGTHKENLDNILKNGIKAPTNGYTAGYVSLALEPNTAFGYASMYGGEARFNKSGRQGVHIFPEDRVVIVVKIPQSYFLKKMGSIRGNVSDYVNKLIDKNLYDEWKRQDQEYYMLTEIRLPKEVPSKFIKGYMVKK